MLFGVGVTAWRPVPAGVWHDDGVYMLVGKALAEGRGLVYAGVVDSPPAAKFPPLYPVVLASIWWILDSIGPVTMAATFLNLALLAVAGALFARALVESSELKTALALAVSALAFSSTDVLRTALVPLSESLFLALIGWALLLWRRVAEGERRALTLLAGVLVAVVATRTAGIALALAFALSLGLRGSVRVAVAATAPAFAFAALWSWWSARASATIEEGARDLLGPYSGWLVEQTISAPAAFLAGLPAHALGIVERVAAIAFPGVTGNAIWVLAALIAPLVALGLYQLIRRFPPLGWFGVIYLGMVLVWPYLDRRLLAPWHPVLLASVAVGGHEVFQRVRSTPWERVVVAFGVVWVVAYTSVTAGRIADGWPTAAYRLRSDRLAASVQALSRTAPSNAIVGAPEFWAALHLHGGWTVAPSTRFDPRRNDPEAPMWGTPEEQLTLWRAMRIDHLLLEQGGTLHGAALDRLEGECPGSVIVLARMASSLVVRIDWMATCERS